MGGATGRGTMGLGLGEGPTVETVGRGWRSGRQQGGEKKGGRERSWEGLGVAGIVWSVWGLYGRGRERGGYGLGLARKTGSREKDGGAMLSVGIRRNRPRRVRHRAGERKLGQGARL